MPGGSSTVEVARTRDGYCVRVRGRGTMRESPAVLEFAVQALAAGPVSLVVDLTDCEYLDSTFLGCLLGIYKRSLALPVRGAAKVDADSAATVAEPAAGVSAASAAPAFAIAAPPERRRQLLGPTRLDAVLTGVDATAEIVGQWTPLSVSQKDAAAVTRHVMECHRRLADIDGPNQAAFRRIADQMATELNKSSPH